MQLLNPAAAEWRPQAAAESDEQGSAASIAREVHLRTFTSVAATPRRVYIAILTSKYV